MTTIKCRVRVGPKLQYLDAETFHVRSSKEVQIPGTKTAVGVSCETENAGTLKNWGMPCMLAANQEPVNMAYLLSRLVRFTRGAVPKNEHRGPHTSWTKNTHTHERGRAQSWTEKDMFCHKLRLAAMYARRKSQPKSWECYGLGMDRHGQQNMNKHQHSAAGTGLVTPWRGAAG